MRCWWSGGERVGSGVAAASGGGEALEEVGPADRMHLGFFLWEVSVFDAYSCTAWDGDEVDLDGAGAGWEDGGAGVAPGDDHPVGGSSWR